MIESITKSSVGFVLNFASSFLKVKNNSQNASGLFVKSISLGTLFLLYILAILFLTKVFLSAKSLQVNTPSKLEKLITLPVKSIICLCAAPVQNLFHPLFRGIFSYF